MCLLLGPKGEGMASDMLARDNVNYALGNFSGGPMVKTLHFH